MIKLFYENIITDLRKQGITLSNDVFNTLNTFIDIQNSTANRVNISRWQDVKNTLDLVSENGDIIAIYNNDKFVYNPNKIKISDIVNYDNYIVSVQGVNVAKRREQRRYDLTGLSRTKDSSISNVPKSTSLIWTKDWDPEVNRRYYSKLLRQNNLYKYTKDLDIAYDLVTDLINHRKEETTIGKRTVYNNMINKLVTQIRKIEDLINSVDKDFNDDDFDKLEKEMKKLPRIIIDAKDLIRTEDDTIRRFGHPKTRPHTKIEK